MNQVSETTAAALKLGQISAVVMKEATNQTTALMGTISAPILLANKGLAIDAFGSLVLPFVAEALRTAMGKFIVAQSNEKEGMLLTSTFPGGLHLQVRRPGAKKRRELDKAMGTNHSAAYDEPNTIVPGLALRVHRADAIPP